MKQKGPPCENVWQAVGKSSLGMEAQNPYQSFIVQASAGSGKTYQLSRRFLYLVASGADPAHILTLTFTVKAANEMRARILADAAALWTPFMPPIEMSYPRLAVRWKLHKKYWPLLNF
jgi:hypothetical protein